VYHQAPMHCVPSGMHCVPSWYMHCVPSNTHALCTIMVHALCTIKHPCTVVPPDQPKPSPYYLCTHTAAFSKTAAHNQIARIQTVAYSSLPAAHKRDVHSQNARIQTAARGMPLLHTAIIQCAARSMPLLHTATPPLFNLLRAPVKVSLHLPVRSRHVSRARCRQQDEVTQLRVPEHALHLKPGNGRMCVCVCVHASVCEDVHGWKKLDTPNMYRLVLGW